MTSSLAVFEAAIRVKINASDKLMFGSQENEKYGNKRYFYTNLHLEDRLNIEFTAC